MKILYKYLPDDFPLEKHLKSPELKLSLVNTLNDPYEGQMTKNAIDKFSDVLLTNEIVFINHINGHGRERAKEIAISSILEVFEKTCITSFSETQRNLLMWSHYAAQHKGLCIGYDTNVLLSPYTDSILRKVNYDSVLYDKEHLDELESTINLDFDKLNEFCYRLFTTKSDDWIYEKEHRYISSFNAATRIIVHSSFEELSPQLKMEIGIAEKKKTHKVIKRKNFFEIHNIKNANDQVKSKSQWIGLEQKILDEHKVTLFRQINISDIKCIYLGVFFDKSKEIELLRKIKTEKKLNHINVYRYEISQDRYGLIPNKIHPESNSTT